MTVDVEMDVPEGAFVDTREVDTGKIKLVQDGAGWAAMLIAPFEPYAFRADVIKWVVVVRDGQDYLDALIAEPFKPTGTFVSFLPEPYMFYEYLFLPTHDKASLEAKELEAQARGYDLAMRMYQSQQVESETVTEPSEGESDGTDD